MRLSCVSIDSLSNNIIFLSPFPFDTDRTRSWFPVEKAKNMLEAKPYQQKYLDKACSGR